MDLYATLWATRGSSAASIIQLLYNHHKWGGQNPVQPAKSFVIMEGGTGEGRSDFSPVLGSFSSFWQVPGLGCRQAEPKWGGTRKLRPMDYLSREDLWIPDSTDTGAPGPHITAALPGLWWPDHHSSGFDSSFPRALHPNCQLKDMLSLLFFSFQIKGFYLFSPSAGYICGLNSFYRSFAFTFLSKKTLLVWPALPRETLILNHPYPFLF